jgi:hypothetical protein
MYAVDGLRVERAREIYEIRSHAADYFGDCDVRYCWLPGSSRSRGNAHCGHGRGYDPEFRRYDGEGRRAVFS